MAATAAAFFIKGLCGFANTLVFQTILSFGTNNINISPVELILTYPANAILTIKERRSIKWSVCLPLTLLVVIGSIPGILLLKNADTTVIKIIFGAVTVLVAAEMLFRDKNGQNRTAGNRIFMFIIGILSGVLCGLYGVGALLGAYIGKMTDDIHGFKANISFVFVVENTIRLVLYIALGIITLDVFKRAVIMLPFMFAGLLLGIFSGKFINEKIVRKAVIILLAISGLSLIITAL